MDGDSYTVYFVEYGCFGTEQRCDVTQMRPLKMQPRFSLAESCLVAPSEGSSALEPATVEKIGLGAARTSCTYHVRLQATGKVRSCVEAEMQPNPAAPKPAAKKPKAPVVDE